MKRHTIYKLLALALLIIAAASAATSQPSWVLAAAYPTPARDAPPRPHAPNTTRYDRLLTITGITAVYESCYQSGCQNCSTDYLNCDKCKPCYINLVHNYNESYTLHGKFSAVG